MLTIQYTAQLKAALGVAEEKIESDGPLSLRGLLRLLTERHGDSFRQYTLSGQDQLAPSVIVCVDDQQIAPDGGFSFASDCTVTFLSAISGG